MINKLNKLILILVSADIAGCNSGIQKVQNNEPQPSTSQMQNSNNSKAKLNDSAEDYIFRSLPDVELGYGYDPISNTVKTPIGYSADKLIDDMTAATVVDFGHPDYSDFASFSGSGTGSSLSNKVEFKGGAGASYGLYALSLKAGFSSQLDASNATLHVIKTVGLVACRTLKFKNFDVKQIPKPQHMEPIENAIYKANSLQFERDIDDVRKARTVNQKNQAIKTFYETFGSHAVISVTKGYIGYHNSILTEKVDSGSSGKGVTVDGGLDTPFVKLSSSYNTSTATKFDSQNWDYSSNTHVLPYNADTLASIIDLYKRTEENLNDSKGIIDLGKLSGQVQPFNAPDLSSLEVKPNQELVDKLKKNEDDRANFLAATAELKNAIVEIETEVNQKNTPNQDRLEASISNLSNEKFISFKLDSLDSLNLEYGINLLNYLKTITEENPIKIELIEQSRANIFKNYDNNKDLQRKPEINFRSWLKDNYTKDPMNGDSALSFEDWYKTVEAVQLARYRSAWELVAMKASPQSVKLMNSLKATNQVKSNVINLKGKSEDSSAESPITLDFDIVPWSEIYPELTPLLLDNSPSVIEEKFLEKINNFINIRNYLGLVKRVTKNSVALDDLYNADIGVQVQLQKIINDISKTYSGDTSTLIISTNSRNYDLTNEADVAALDELINSKIRNSALFTSPWYSIAKDFQEKGLLSPRGILLGVPLDYFYSQNMDNNDYQISLGFIRINNSANMLLRPSGVSAITDKNPGQQVASTVNFDSGNIVMPTAIPIITLNSSRDEQGNITNIDLLVGSNAGDASQSLYNPDQYNYLSTKVTLNLNNAGTQNNPYFKSSVTHALSNQLATNFPGPLYKREFDNLTS